MCRGNIFSHCQFGVLKWAPVCRGNISPTASLVSCYGHQCVVVLFLPLSAWCLVMGTSVSWYYFSHCQLGVLLWAPVCRGNIFFYCQFGVLLWAPVCCGIISPTVSLVSCYGHQWVEVLVIFVPLSDLCFVMGTSVLWYYFSHCQLGVLLWAPVCHCNISPTASLVSCYGHHCVVIIFSLTVSLVSCYGHQCDVVIFSPTVSLVSCYGHQCVVVIFLLVSAWCLNMGTSVMW